MFDSTRAHRAGPGSDPGDDPGDAQGSSGFEDQRFTDQLDELGCHTTTWLHGAREEAVREQRRWRLRELAITRVLDDRGAIDDTLAQSDGVSVRAVRETVATARALADLPEIARVMARGDLSDDQLTQVVKVADPEDDHRWAAEAASWSPADLAHQARLKQKPTAEDAAVRRAARELRFWWRRDHGMLDGRFSLPDIDGAVFESVMNDMIERMRPAKGRPWATREHRGADALVELCRAYADRDVNTPTSGNRAHFVVQVPTHGPATVAGIPLPDAMVERLRANARIEPVLTGEDAEPIAVGRTESVLTEKDKRVVRQRDGKCRWPGCDRRVGLEVHHLWPRTWEGPDEKWNLASVCSIHHPELVPQGPMLLLGNPNHPAGLSLVHRDELATLAADRARAGPVAAPA